MDRGRSTPEWRIAPVAPSARYVHSGRALGLRFQRRTIGRIVPGRVNDHWDFGRAEFAHWNGNCSYALCQTVADTATSTRGMQLLPGRNDKFWTGDDPMPV